MYSLGAGHLLTVGVGGGGESLEDFQNNLQFILATIDKIAYLESIFLNIVNVTVAILPSPLPLAPGSSVVVSSKESLILELL